MTIWFRLRQENPRRNSIAAALWPAIIPYADYDETSIARKRLEAMIWSRIRKNGNDRFELFGVALNHTRFLAQRAAAEVGCFRP